MKIIYNKKIGIRRISALTRRGSALAKERALSLFERLHELEQYTVETIDANFIYKFKTIKSEVFIFIYFFIFGLLLLLLFFYFK
jgi:hypothetical protein